MCGPCHMSSPGKLKVLPKDTNKSGKAHAFAQKWRRAIFLGHRLKWRLRMRKRVQYDITFYLDLFGKVTLLTSWWYEFRKCSSLTCFRLPESWYGSHVCANPNFKEKSTRYYIFRYLSKSAVVTICIASVLGHHDLTASSVSSKVFHFSSSSKYIDSSFSRTSSETGKHWWLVPKKCQGSVERRD